MTLVRYETGRWRRQSHKVSQMYVGFPGRGRPQKLLRQKIKLEANDSETLFAIRPIRDAASGPSRPPYLNPMDGTLLRADARGGTYDYEVFSDPVPGGTQPGEEPPSFVHTELLLSIRNSSRCGSARSPNRSWHPSRETAGTGKPTRPPSCPSRNVRSSSRRRRKITVARAAALESYLRERAMSYSLHMEVVDPRLDPVEDFLINRKEGHCEYFASAPGAAAPLDRHPGPGGQRIQGGRLERPDANHERAPEARA